MSFEGCAASPLIVCIGVMTRLPFERSRQLLREAPPVAWQLCSGELSFVALHSVEDGEELSRNSDDGGLCGPCSGFDGLIEGAQAR